MGKMGNIAGEARRVIGYAKHGVRAGRKTYGVVKERQVSEAAVRLPRDLRRARNRRATARRLYHK